MKLLFVVPRFGEAIVGGAERLAALLASRAVGDDDTVEIATTCAVDHHTWRNDLPPGRSVEGGLTVHRFAVSPRDEHRFGVLHTRLLTDGHLSYIEELELMGHSVWSSDLQRFLELQGDSFDLILFVPYLVGTTYWGMQAFPERSVLIPCIHDEPNAHMACVREMVEASAGCIFNSEAESRLAHELYNVPRNAVVGLGFDPPEQPAKLGFADRHRLGRYVVYVGRLEEAKGIAVATDFVTRYARKHAADLRLVLVGAGTFQPSREQAPYVVRAGFLSEEEKRSALAEAIALVHPSRLESLSIVLMEAWLEGTPALVAAQSEVLRDQCAASGGGMTFTNYKEFAEGLDLLLGDPHRRDVMGKAGQTYVTATSRWPQVQERFARTLSEIVSTTGVKAI